MKVSFSTARKLGIGMLLGLVLLGATFSVQSLRQVTKKIYDKIELQEVKERHFTHITLRFSMVGADFYRYRLQAKLSTEHPKLVQNLNTIRGILAQLQTLPLTPGEAEGITKLRFEERRFRTALYVFIESGVDDPAQETAAKAVADIEQIVDGAVARAIHYSYRTSEIIEQTNRQIAQSAQHITKVLTIGAGLAALTGLSVSLILSWSFKHHLEVILYAAKEFGKGHFSYRINSPFKDPMGQLAHSIDDMAGRLETYECQQQTTLDELMEAKNVSDAQARELAARALELDRAREVAEEANQAKSMFLANMSHELRTPLHVILNNADFGMEKVAIAPPAKLQRYFEKINQSGQTLLELVNALLDLAKLEAGKMPLTFEPGTLHPLLAAIVDEFTSLLSQRRLMLQYIPPPFPTDVHLDPTRIMQVLRNLLSNAVKFSPPDSTIELRVERGAQDLIVSILDQGPGIPTEELDLVFASFVQSSTTKTGAGGTGLGLAISNEIVAAHGGRIWAENRPEGGAALTFTLLLHTQDTKAPSSASVGTGTQPAERPSALAECSPDMPSTGASALSQE